MDFTPGQRKLLLYWGNIVQSVSARAPTALLWQDVRAAAAAEGQDLSGVRLTDMNGLRSIAASQRVAGQTLAAARVDAVIDAGMIGRDLDSRSLQEQQLAPRWRVRFEQDVIVSGSLKTVWRTSYIDGILPSTKADVLSQVEQDAQALADDYDEVHAGVGTVQITAV